MQSKVSSGYKKTSDELVHKDGLTFTEYPSFDDKDQAIEYICQLLYSDSIDNVKEIDTNWQFDTLSKSAVDEFEDAYEEVLEEEIGSLRNLSERCRQMAYNSISLGIILGGMGGYFAGDMVEGTRLGGIAGSGLGLCISFYSVYLDRLELEYAGRLDDLHRKFIEEPIKKLYGFG